MTDLLKRPMIARESDPAFKALAKFLSIPSGTNRYKLEFEAGGIVTIEINFDMETLSEDVQ